MLLLAEAGTIASLCLHLGIVVLVIGLEYVRCMVACGEAEICPYARRVALVMMKVWEGFWQIL